jgi:hypothetical protein
LDPNTQANNLAFVDLVSSYFLSQGSARPTLHAWDSFKETPTKTIPETTPFTWADTGIKIIDRLLQLGY